MENEAGREKNEAMKFLKEIGTLPKLVSKAIDLIGTSEIPGPKSNATIIKWAKDVGVGYNDDDIAWCGLFVAYVVKKTGRVPVTNPLWARNWAKWGVKSEKPELGDILVFSRGTGGHVGFYVAEDNTAYYVLGGNQGNTVSIVRIAKNRLLAARRPIYNEKPASVKSYVIDGEGELSTNEA
jgi:uncharacterized protein (TIGR02594 family)